MENINIMSPIGDLDHDNVGAWIADNITHIHTLKSLLTGMKSCPGAEHTHSVTCRYNVALHYKYRDIW